MTDIIYNIVPFLLSGMLDNEGNPCSGGLLYSYDAGTTTKRSLFQDYALTEPHTNPLELDGSGRALAYANGNYKFVLKSAQGVTLYTWDNIALPSGAIGPSGPTGPQGEQGLQGIQGDTGASIVSVAWNGNDMVFTKDDTDTVTLTGAKTDLTGPQGEQGVKGDKGDTGTGVPAGGTTGQELTKKSNTDYDFEWKSRNRVYTWVISNPAVGGILGPRLPEAHTVQRIDSYVKAATSVTFNIEERSTIGSAGSNILSEDQIADTDGASATGSFNDSSLAEGNWLYVDISAVSGTPEQVVITLTCTI